MLPKFKTYTKWSVHTEHNIIVYFSTIIKFHLFLITEIIILAQTLFLFRWLHTFKYFLLTICQKFRIIFFSSCSYIDSFFTFFFQFLYQLSKLILKKISKLKLFYNFSNFIRLNKFYLKKKKVFVLTLPRFNFKNLLI